MDTLTYSLHHPTTFTSLFLLHFVLSLFSQLSFYLTSCYVPSFLTQIGDLFILLQKGLSCHPFTYFIDIYSETISLRGLCHFIRVGLLYLALGEIFVYFHISLFLICFI